MAFRPRSPTSLVLFITLLPLLLLLLLSPSAADENNLLLTGDVLHTNGQLSNSAATFVIQDDCNLVLYNKANGFESNTHGAGTKCTLTLTNRGQLTIRSSGSFVWSSPSTPSPKVGKYAAILRPDGQLAVYGPAVWSTPINSTNSNDRFSAELAAIPMVDNVLFSDQILYNGAKLTTRDYTFVMRPDCGLALVKASVGDKWAAGTAGKGKNCFARLDHRGELSVEDDGYKKLWGSESVGADGDYVLVMQINGQAVIYGPIVWSTLSG